MYRAFFGPNEMQGFDQGWKHLYNFIYLYVFVNLIFLMQPQQNGVQTVPLRHMRETTWLNESGYNVNKQVFVGLENETIHATEKCICIFIYY